MFWRPASGSREAQRSFFEKLVASGESICLVHDADKVLNGFIMALSYPLPLFTIQAGKCV
jgi:hypothetical protein